MIIGFSIGVRSVTGMQPQAPAPASAAGLPSTGKLHKGPGRRLVARVGFGQKIKPYSCKNNAMEWDCAGVKRVGAV
jgi:hypothetical protein